jgi:hypothetical protein
MIFSKKAETGFHFAGNTEEKVGLRQPDILVVKLTQTLFLNIILRKKYLKKNRKNGKFSNIFSFHLGCSMRSKHKQLIWCIFMKKQLQKM